MLMNGWAKFEHIIINLGNVTTMELTEIEKAPLPEDKYQLTIWYTSTHLKTVLTGDNRVKEFYEMLLRALGLNTAAPTLSDPADNETIQ